MENIGETLFINCLENKIQLDSSRNMHLAIVNQPYLNLILEGKKTIESRFTINKCAPYNKIKSGDIVFIKDAGKPVIAYFKVRAVQFIINENQNVDNIKENFSKEICANNDEFWSERKCKRYISLIWIDTVVKINPFNVEKKDKRAWVTIPINNLKKIIVISGKIGTGKTYWANKISDNFNINYTSFSKYLKYICMKKNIAPTRENLQCIGDHAIKTDFENFMNYVLKNNFRYESDFLVIDGLRHKKVLEYLKNKYNSVLHIHIDINESVRRNNLMKRDGVYNTYDNNIVESEISNLKNDADIIIDEYLTDFELYTQINDYLLDNKSKQLKLII